MSKICRKYLFLTFLIMIICWGACVICSINDVNISNNYLLYVPYLLGGWSPTIASFIVITIDNKEKGAKKWLFDVFDFKQKITSYIMVIVFSVLLVLPQFVIYGYTSNAPLFAIIFLVPLTLFMGGLEEAGWRYILQPELEKKFNFVISTILVSIIWWLWHLPLFFIQETSQYGQSFFTFGILALGLSFALACIRKNTGSVWLCVLFHCLVNSLFGIYGIGWKLWGNVAAALTLIVVSLVWVTISNKKKNTKSNPNLSSR